MERIPIFVFISGTGKTLEAIINSCKVACVQGVYSSDPTAPGLQYAVDNNIRSLSAHNKSVLTDLKAMISHLGKPKIIVLAGYMKILPIDFIDYCYDNDIILVNTHPSLLPKHRGLNTHQRALDAGDTIHGFTIHLVTEILDHGPIIAQESFNVCDGDTATMLENAVKIRERIKYPMIIDSIAIS